MIIQQWKKCYIEADKLQQLNKKQTPFSSTTQKSSVQDAWREEKVTWEIAMDSIADAGGTLQRQVVEKHVGNRFASPYGSSTESATSKTGTYPW